MQIKEVPDLDSLLSAMAEFPRVRAVYDATSAADGDSSTEIRRRIIAYANHPTEETKQVLPVALQSFIQKVVQESHKVTERDINNLKKGGYSEDFIFEITVTASLGAGLRRFSAGINALNSQ